MCGDRHRITQDQFRSQVRRRHVSVSSEQQRRTVATDARRLRRRPWSVCLSLAYITLTLSLGCNSKILLMLKAQTQTTSHSPIYT